MAWRIVKNLLIRQLEAWPDIVGKRFLGMSFGEGQRSLLEVRKAVGSYRPKLVMLNLFQHPWSGLASGTSPKETADHGP